MEGAATSVATNAANRIIETSVLGALLIGAIIVGGLIITFLWREMKASHQRERDMAKDHSVEVADLNKQLNALLKQSIEREVAQERRLDLSIEVLDRTLHRLAG